MAGGRRLLRLLSRDVYTNLATEEVLFQRGPANAILFYVNRSSVVLGRTQNAFVEADVEHAEAHGVAIARRRSGGGCVMHDEGNLNFCFVSARSEFDKFYNAELVSSVLRDSFGVPTAVNDRADIVANGRKISGNAYRISRDRAYHHGTVLVNSDLGTLRRALRSPIRDRITALGTPSVRSPVANIIDFCPGVNVNDVVDAVASHVGCLTESVSHDDVELEYGGVGDERALLDSYDWVYGQTPRFQLFLDVRGVRIVVHVAKGAIVKALEVEDDVSESTMAAIEKIRAQLVDQCFAGDCISNQLKPVARMFKGTEHENFVEDFVTKLVAYVPAQYWCAPKENSRYIEC